MTRLLIAAAAIIVVAAATYSLFQHRLDSDFAGSAEPMDSSAVVDSTRPSNGVENDDSAKAAPAGSLANTDIEQPETLPSSNTADLSTSSGVTVTREYAGQGADALGVDLYAIGVDAPSDAEFLELTRLLEENPAFMAELFEQFRYETDPDRLKRLSHLLGQFDDPLIPELASEMVFSGNTGSQLAALDLLRQVQDKNPAARNVLIDVLASESEPSVLSMALNAVNTPGEPTDLQRQNVMSNVTSLAQHDDPIIRARSIGVITKWTDDNQSTPLILGALSDTDVRVRQKAVYSLINYPYPDDNVRRQLMSVAENESEDRRARRGAIQALSGMDLSDDESGRLKAARSSVNRSPNR